MSIRVSISVPFFEFVISAKFAFPTPSLCVTFLQFVHNLISILWYKLGVKLDSITGCAKNGAAEFCFVLFAASPQLTRR